MKLLLRREFDVDGASVQLVVRSLGREITFLDAKQVEVLASLLESALPRLHEAEAEADGEWKAWRERSRWMGGR